jgi:hypothetical protein
MADFGPHSEPHPDVAGYLFGTLEPDEAQRFASHLDSCDACQGELAALARIPDLLADLPPAIPLPADLEARTFAFIEAAAAPGVGQERPAAGAGAEPASSDPAGAASAGGEPAGAPGGTVIPITQLPKKRWRPPLLLIAAAVAVVIGLAVGVIASLGSSTAPAHTIRLVSISGGPAHGTAQVRSTPAGLTIDMTVEDLAPSSPGTFYTCWLVGPGDTLRHPNRVSVGSFVVREKGAVRVHWTTAADVHRFPQLGVTLEPDNGNPAHQGPKVLAGTVAV